MLEAARGRIASASLSIENLALARDLMLDPLTGIANRRAFDAWLTAVHPVETAAALMLLDLDQFKQINDLHGHAVGDDVLRAVSRLLVAHVRPGDLALRLGGDELAVVVQHPPADAATSRSLDLATLAATADERAAALAEAVAATDWDQVASGLRVRISVGVAVGFLGPHGVRGGRPALPGRRRRAVRRQVTSHPQRRLSRPQRSSVRVHTSATRPAYSSGVAPRPVTSRKYSGLFIDHTRSATSSSVRSSRQLAGGPQVGGEQPHVAGPSLVQPLPHGPAVRVRLASHPQRLRDRHGARQQPAEGLGVDRDLGPRPVGLPHGPHVVALLRGHRLATAEHRVVHREQHLRLAADTGVDGVHRHPRPPGDLRDGGAGVPVLGEERGGGPQDPTTGRLGPTRAGWWRRSDGS